ncbi:serine hydrolase FSH, partial [Roridomyces roridus]
VYVDAPHILLAVDLPGSALSQASASAVTISDHPARAWWRFLYTMRDVEAVHKSFEYMRRVLEEQGPFDGILGFSQGASFAAMIVAHMENQDMPGCLLRGVNHPQFQFAILLSGFFAPCDVVALPRVPIRTPSLHIFGIHDIMVSPENMARLTTYFDAPRVEVHAGGHFIPRTQAWTRFIAAYLKS